MLLKIITQKDGDDLTHYCQPTKRDMLVDALINAGHTLISEILSHVYEEIPIGTPPIKFTDADRENRRSRYYWYS